MQSKQKKKRGEIRNLNAEYNVKFDFQTEICFVHRRAMTHEKVNRFGNVTFNKVTVFVVDLDFRL